MEDKYRVVLILRSGGDFAFRDVQLLASRICAWYNNPPDIFCVTDLVKKETQLKGVTLIPHPNPEWPGWWSKMILFSPQLEPLRPFLYMDLDTAVVGRMDGVSNPVQPSDFVMLRDFHSPVRPASGLMWIPKDSRKIATIWKIWIGKPEGIIKQFRGDQDYIRSVSHPDSFWQDICPNRVFSFKPSRTQWLEKLPGSAEVVCFHGKPRPRQATSVDWVNKYLEVGLAPPLPPVGEEKPILVPFMEDPERIDSRPFGGGRPWFSLLCPTRGRPDMCKRFITSAYNHARWPGQVEVLLYVDSDDSALPLYVEMVTDTPARIVTGPSEGVGRAWNCLARASSGEYVMMANDDLVYESDEWDWKILKRLLTVPDQLVLAYANDGINGNKHCAFPIVSRRWCEELGQFVPEKYKFFRHDTDLWETAKQIGSPSRILYFGDVRITHYHHSTGKSEADETTWRNRRNNQNKQDELIYNSAGSIIERRAKGGRLRRAVMESKHYHENEFGNLVRGKKVALVGPSPHLTRKGLGEVIDSYDVICRVNEILPIGLEKDYGSRSEILFYGCNMNNISNFQKTLEKLREEKPDILDKVRFFMASQRRYDSINIFAMEQFLKSLHQYTPGVMNGIVSLCKWSFWQRWIGTHPNTGIFALLMLAQEQPKELFLTGFSFYSQGLQPNQRHHSAYIKYGGDAGYNQRAMKKDHVQEVQSAWFKDQFMPIYGGIVRVDSYLDNLLNLGHDKVCPLNSNV